MTADGDVRRSIVERARAELRFLTYRCDSTDVRDEDGITTLQFVAPPVFVELELDWRERAVFTLLGELKGGRVPDGYYMDSDGQPARWHLSAILARDGRVSEAHDLRQGTKDSGPPAMLTQIVASAEELRAALPHLPRLVSQMRTDGPNA